MRKWRERGRKLRKRKGKTETGLLLKKKNSFVVDKKNFNTQEMEREEGEGVEGGVWAEGEEEGGQGHEEQDDGQGVEVPELQVGSDKDIQ